MKNTAVLRVVRNKIILKWALISLVIIMNFFSSGKITRAVLGPCSDSLMAETTFRTSPYNTFCGYADLRLFANNQFITSTSGITVLAGSSMVAGAGVCNPVCRSDSSGIGNYYTSVTFNGVTTKLTDGYRSNSDTRSGTVFNGSFFTNAPNVPGTYNMIFENWLTKSPTKKISTIIPITVVGVPVHGSCAPTHYNCNTGNSANNTETVNSWTWTCSGSNGGLSASCSENKGTGTIKISVVGVPIVGWTVTGPELIVSQSGGTITYGSKPIGIYTINWGNVVGYITPPSQSLTLLQDGTISFVGNYDPVCVSDYSNYSCTKSADGCNASTCGTTLSNLCYKSDVNACEGAAPILVTTADPDYASNCSSCSPIDCPACQKKDASWREVAP